MNDLEKEIDFIKNCPNYTIFAIDLFCGAGGETTGIEKATIKGNKCAKVIACVNHDKNAIMSHEANHKNTLHFIEDIRTLNSEGLEKLVKTVHAFHPKSYLLLHASLECTNFSKAKGGQARDADSRTLAEHLFRYVEALNPDYIQIENVREFMMWGDLDENGKPVSKDAGRLYLRWVRKMCSYGYKFAHRILNAADYGAYTSRERFFGIFAKESLPIVFPEPTHSRNGESSLFGRKEEWKPVKDVLDLNDSGNSIFREKPLSEKTLQRIYAGLIKFVAGGKEAFLIKWNSMNAKGEYKPPSIEKPCPTITTQNRLGIAKVNFLSKQYSGEPEGKNISVDRPAGTITTKDHHAFITAYYGNGSNHSLKEPAPTLTTKDRLGYITAQFIDKQYGTGRAASLDSPAGTVTTNPKLNLVTIKPWLMDTSFNNVGTSIDRPARELSPNNTRFYLMNPQFNSSGGSIDAPCFTLIARMDKRPPYLISAETGTPTIVIYDTDSTMTVKIKEFMALYGITDICMRMLKISELKKIMGFPEDYILVGTQTEQKKYIGNAVETHMACALCQCLASEINKNNNSY